MRYTDIPQMRVVALLCFLFSFSPSTRAEVVRLEIEKRGIFAQGHPFGRTGPYEKIAGKLRLEVDPGADANARIVDLQLAPRNERGKVEFWSDFFLLKPLDPSHGNRRLFYGVNNRGNKLALSFFNDQGGNDPSTLADAGNGFLMRQGYAVLWCGWNGDVRAGDGRLEMGLPVARKDGRTITGKIYAEICVDRKSFSEPFYWGNSKPYPAVSLDDRQATLTMRPRRSAAPTPVEREKWAFARFEGGKVIPDPTHLYLEEGFRPGWLYDLVYTGKDPRLTGLGFAAVRDTVSFLRHAGADRRGTANPLAGYVDRAYIFGVSQSGRFTIHFIYEGFNSDEKGRIVFDGAIPHVGGGGKGLFNSRFAQTTRHGSQHEENLYPSEFFPFTTVHQKDPLTGEEGDLLARARASGCVPKIFFTETSTEYWARGGSLLHTDVEGERDVAPASDVRLYFFTGAQHGVSSSPDRGIYQYPRNILDYRPLLRALLVALDEWVTHGREPPPSSYPRIADGSLVDLETYRSSFPAIPGVRLPAVLYVPRRLDLGPRWRSRGINDRVPPQAGEPYGVLVPAVDADGNEIAGIRLPAVAVPLATYAGWNLRSSRCGAEGMLARWNGSYLPLARTAGEREKAGDPRPSIRERYPTRERYVAGVATSALELEERCLLLPEDLVRILRRAAARDDW
jgi:hypothetical protein